MSFYLRGVECKSRKLRDIWSNRQVWPWSTKWSRAKVNGVLSREHIGPQKYPFPATQKMTLHMDITRLSIPKLDWLYSLQPKMEKLCRVGKKTRLGVVFGSDHEFIIAKFRLILKKVGKTTWPLWCDLNQGSYDYTVEMTNIFKGLRQSAWRTVKEDL